MPSEKTKEETLTQLLAEVVESARRVAFTEVMAKTMGNNQTVNRMLFAAENAHEEVLDRVYAQMTSMLGGST